MGDEIRGQVREYIMHVSLWVKVMENRMGGAKECVKIKIMKM